MPPSIPTRKKRERPLSGAATSEIDDRVVDARPRVLADIGRLCVDRNGELTPPQVEAIAAILSHMSDPPSSLPNALREWLIDHNAAASLTDAWAASPAGGRLLARLEDATSTAVRRDLPAKSLRQIFASDPDAERLQLESLVPERVRSTRRRRAEGAVERAASAAPWLAVGISRATWFRRQASEAARETRATIKNKIVEAVDAAATEPRACIWSFESHVPADDEIYVLPRLPPSPTERPLSPGELPTAEARRYAAAALSAGATWQPREDHDPRAPATWLALPDDLHELVLYGLRQAASAAATAARRRARVEAARKRERQKERETAGPRDAQTRPERVSEAAWAMVPKELRPAVRVLAGRLFVQGYEPDAAVTVGTHAAQREASRAAAIAAALPDAPTELVAAEARARWWVPLDKAVSDGLAAIKARLTDPLADLDPDAIAQARELLLRLRPHESDDWTLAALARLLAAGLAPSRSGFVERAWAEGREARSRALAGIVVPSGPPRHGDIEAQSRLRAYW